MTQLYMLAFLSLGILLFVPGSAHGHGDPTETFPPVELDGRLVTLEISSDPATDNDDQRISISMIDFDSKITLRDVTFLIKSERGETFLFEQEFRADSGSIVFNFVSEDTDSVVVREAEGGLFGSLLGLDNYLFHVRGPNLGNGGLYKFDVTVLTADGYSRTLAEPLVFNGGVSIAQTTTHAIADPNFGNQTINVITYYDEISGFEYDWESRGIRYSMPFEWSQENIDQTLVVHEEISVPYTFGDLLVSGFTLYLNGVQMPEDVVQVDDFFTDWRTVHFIIPQRILFEILEDNQDLDGMDFVILPDRSYPHLRSVTENGQFRILLQWEPENLGSGSDARILFDVTDIFLKNRPVAVSYEFSITQNGRTIFEQKGTSSDSRESHNVAEFVIPEDVSGIVHLNFENLADNGFAKTTLPVVVDRVMPQSDPMQIPGWIKNNALLWSQGQIDDGTFIGAIQYLIQNGIITVSQTSQDDGSQDIPDWVRTNAALWAGGQIDDGTFVLGLEFLIQAGIINI